MFDYIRYVAFARRIVKKTLKLVLPFLLGAGSSHFSPADPGPTHRIIVDEVGYRPHDNKVAFVKNVGHWEFDLVDATTKRTVLKHKTDLATGPDEISGDTLSRLNFSDFSTPGVYYLEIPSLNVRSDDFKIGEDVYGGVARTSLRSYFYERCGTAIDVGSPWDHPACHTNDAVFYSNPDLHIDVSGGWHDAGDYNKFVVTTATSAAFILYAYDVSPTAFSYGTSSSAGHLGREVPYAVDEAKWGLTWLLKMQREDGGVYHKVSIARWTGEHLPQSERDTRYIFDVSSAATGDFAAVAALGARIMKTYYPGFADSLLRAAIKSWEFLEKHPSIVPEGGFKNPSGVEGGEYGDANDSDERLWASVELYRVTGSSDYLDYFVSHYKTIGGPNYPVSWQSVANLACYSFLQLPSTNAIASTREAIVGNLETYCNEVLRRVDLSEYNCALSPDNFYWGSNSVDLGYAFDLIMAYEATGQAGYLNAALDQLHYILGRNTFGRSFVTQVGTNSVKYPYHQFSMLETPGNPVPGMVVGGPNKFSRLNGKVISQSPAKCYEDNEKNYFVNEPAINYTAPLVFVAAYFGRPELNEPRNETAGDSRNIQRQRFRR